MHVGNSSHDERQLGDTTNVFPDYDMRDTAFYSSDGPAVTLVAVTDPVSGANELRLANIGEAWSGWCNIEPSSHFRARAVTRNVAANAQRIGTVFIEFGTVGAGGTVTPTRRVQILQRSNATTHVAAEIDETLTASENRFRFVLVRSGTDTGSFVTMSGLRVRKRMAGELIVDGAITAAKVGANEVIANTANIKDGVITNAKINDLSAAKLIAGTALASTITVNGTTLDLVETRAADPAARVNLGTTQIDPGKILISGATTLADWRRGGDQTKIDGGAISANTIDANKLTVGNRGITVTNVTFDYTPGTNQVTWTSGQVRWVNDAGTTTTTNINAGSATWSTGVLYIYFDKTGTLKTTTAIGTAFGTNAAILASYAGGNNLVTDYGKTVIDGGAIKTGTLTAAAVDTTSFLASGLAVFGGELKSGNYVADTSGWRIDNNGNAEFGTLALRPGAVSQTVAAEASGPVTANSTTWVDVVSLTIAPTSGAPLIVWYSAVFGVFASYAEPGDGGYLIGYLGTLSYRLIWRGSAVRTREVPQGVGVPVSDILMIASPGTNSGTLTLQIQRSSGAQNVTAKDATLLSMELKR